MNFLFPKGDFYLFDELKFREFYLGFLKSFKMGMHLCFLYGIFFGAVLWTGKRKTFSVYGEGGYSERIDGRSVVTMFFNMHMVTICSKRILFSHEFEVLIKVCRHNGKGNVLFSFVMTVVACEYSG